MSRSDRFHQPHRACARLVAGAAALAFLAVPSASPAARTRLPLGCDSVAFVEHAINLDRDRLYEGLELRCDIVLATPGTYRITSALSPEYQCFSWLAWPLTAEARTRSELDGLQADKEPGSHLDDEVRTDSTGRARLDVWFDGNDLARFGHDGPWWFSISASRLDSTGRIVPVGEPGRGVCLLAQTHRWRCKQFDTRYMGELDPHPRGGVLGSPDAVILTRGWDLIVAHVVRADSGGTNASPPRVTLEIDRTLLGSGLERRLASVWAPERLFVPCGVGEEEHIRQWEASSYPAPPPGSRWILAGARAPGDSLWRSQPYFRWPYSDSLLTHLEGSIRAWPARAAGLRQKKAELEARQRQAQVGSEEGPRR